MKLTSVENICEDQLWRVVSERREANKELVETDTERPPINCRTLNIIYTHHTILW